MKLATVITFAGALSLVAVLANARGNQYHPDGTGVVYVYHILKCDTSEADSCQDITPANYRAFPTLEACKAFGIADLNSQHDPNRMGSCNKAWEA